MKDGDKLIKYKKTLEFKNKMLATTKTFEKIMKRKLKLDPHYLCLIFPQ